MAIILSIRQSYVLLAKAEAMFSTGSRLSKESKHKTRLLFETKQLWWKWKETTLV